MDGVRVDAAAWDLIEFATKQLEEGTTRIEELIRERESNIKASEVLEETLKLITSKEMQIINDKRSKEKNKTYRWYKFKK